MIEYKNVLGSYESSRPMIINHDLVYLHTNIKYDPVEISDGVIAEYIYDEIIMSKNEYIEYLQIENQNQQQEIDSLKDTMQDLIIYTINNLENKIV